jgi:hypothetical protein
VAGVKCVVVQDLKLEMSKEVEIMTKNVVLRPQLVVLNKTEKEAVVAKEEVIEKFPLIQILINTNIRIVSEVLVLQN